MIFRMFLLATALSLFSTVSLASQNFSNLVEVDLYSYRDHEIFGKTVAEVKEMNEQSLRELNAFKITSKKLRKGKLLDSISQEQADQLIESLEANPITAYANYEKYNRPSHEKIEIGYCFGRATYVDLALRKLGVNEDAIKKIWVVGPLDQGSSISWGFHVATLVKGNSGSWLAVDNYPGSRALTAEQWVERMLENGSPNAKLRFYITNPEKFSISLGRYTQTQMGLNMTSGEDWYRGFFKDLMKWLSTCSGKNSSNRMNTGLSCIGISDFRTSGPKR